MKTCEEVHNKTELQNYFIRHNYAGTLKIKEYDSTPDPRIGWCLTYIILTPMGPYPNDRWAPIGFCNFSQEELPNV